MEPVTDQPAKVVKSEDEWREQLTPSEYRVLRQAGTEAPFVGEYTDTKTKGVYRCRACGAELFRSDTKFDSHCGWPSFFTPLAGDAVIERSDYAMGMKRTEVLCANCHSHLGHVFEGTNKRGPARWITRCTVTASEPGKVFSFDVQALGVRAPRLRGQIANWSYTFEPVDGGTLVTETWTDHRTRWPDWVAASFDKVATGSRFYKFQRGNIARTLKNLKADFEKQPANEH